MIPFAPAARRYLRMLRLSHIAFFVAPIAVLAVFVLPSSGWVFAGMSCTFVVCFAVVFVAMIYASEFTCPQCGLDYAFRQHGKGRALKWCVNCGLSLKEVAESDLPSES